MEIVVTVPSQFCAHSGHDISTAPPRPGAQEPARTPGRPKHMTLSRFARTAAAAAVLGLGAVGCGSQVAATAGHPAPKKLSLAGTAAPGPTAGAASPPAMPMPGPAGLPGWLHVELAGTLPASGPAHGAVRNLPGGTAPLATVRALATALRLTGSPRRVGAEWRVTGTGTLVVTDGPGVRWMYVASPLAIRCLAPIIRVPPAHSAAGVSGAGTGVPAGSGAGTAVGSVAGKAGAANPTSGVTACPMKPGQLEPAEPLPTPTAGAPSGQAAEAAAAPVLRAAAVAGAPLRVTTIGSFTFVSADPAVDGLATAGFATTVGVGPGERITQASGWLSRPAAGAVYPLIGAKQAFDRLKSSSRPTAGSHPPEVMCPLNPDVLCGRAGPIRLVLVTGATYGLALRYDEGRPMLVPSWLFSIAGSDLRVPEVAVDPRYLTG